MTTRIDSAWRYGRYIVVFGWAGLAGLNTVIDAGTGAEALEFLGYDPAITPNGLIVFRRFYPHFSDPAIVSDRIAVLNLNLQIPYLVPAKDQVPTESVGVDIYPRAPTKEERHLIGGNHLITDQGALLILVDQATTGKLCVVRLSLANTASDSEKHHCPTAADLGGADPGEVHVGEFSEQPGGDLILSLDIPKSEPGSLPRVFKIDRQSLAVTRLWSTDDIPDGTLRVPWLAQKSAALSVVLPDLHLPDSAKVDLTIDVYGNVRDVTLSGVSPETLDRLRNAILGWKFKPTFLDGRKVEVVTQIVGPGVF